MKQKPGFSSSSIFFLLLVCLLEEEKTREKYTEIKYFLVNKSNQGMVKYSLLYLYLLIKGNKK